MKYYVYIHRDPGPSQVDLYVGMGQGDRAYRIGSGNSYSDRHPDHQLKLTELLKQGWLPHEWVIFDSFWTTRREAFKREYQLIKELRPLFNRKYGPKKKLNNEEIKEVRNLFLSGKYTKTLIGKKFNCSINTITRILTNKRGIY